MLMAKEYPLAIFAGNYNVELDGLRLIFYDSSSGNEEKYNHSSC